MNPFHKMRGIRITSPLLSGVSYAFLYLIVCTLIVSFLLLLSGLHEDHLNLSVYVIHTVALMMGGIVAGRRANRKGWYYGGLTGIFYAIIIMLVSLLGFNMSPGAQTFLLIIASFLLGALGGMIGVNTVKSTK